MTSGECGGNFSGSSGNITSPNFPQAYPPNSYCIYTITVPQGRACVEFRNYSIRSIYHVISVYEGTSQYGRGIRRYVHGYSFCVAFFERGINMGSFARPRQLSCL